MFRIQGNCALCEGSLSSGELVYLDPVNRRGAIRMQDNYWSGPAHYFALLPYATVRYNGAHAELRDVPLGTHVHGYFFVPPKGEEETIPPLPDEHKKFAVPHNHAISLEDDFSFYQRQGQSWKVVAIDVENEKINVEPAGTKTQDGINTPYTFDIDARTRIWKDRRLSDLADIKIGTTVQLNLTWAANWGQKEFGIGDIWLDDVSRISRPKCSGDGTFVTSETTGRPAGLTRLNRSILVAASSR